MGRRRSGFEKYTKVRIEPCMTKVWGGGWKKLIEFEGLG